MDWFPFFHRLTDAPILVVGGGSIAERKLRLLLRGQPKISLVAKRLNVEVQALVDDGLIKHVGHSFAAEQLTGQVLVIAATDDAAVNKAVATAAKAMNLPVNVVDNLSLSSIIMPSILDRSPIIAAISSSGAAPVLVRNIRAQLETLIPPGLGRLANFASRQRAAVSKALPESLRRRFWETVLYGPIAEQVLAGDEANADALFSEALRRSAKDQAFAEGEVYLVGAGPGDAELLTLKALRLMQQADVVLYDRLVSSEVMDLVRRDAERINVGKERDRHPVPQEEINSLLIKLAKQGRRVLRLKGGDPFVFGRGGEEIQELATAGVSFQVVPGITAATGCAAYAGIPLTHRDYARSCQFVTAHRKQGQFDLDWANLVAAQQTVVFYMGVHGLAELCTQLIAHGAPDNRAVAIVEQGATQRQRVLLGNLSSIAELAANAGIKPPALLIVGDVVQLQDKLSWFKPSFKPSAVELAS